MRFGYGYGGGFDVGRGVTRVSGEETGWTECGVLSILLSGNILYHQVSWS